MRYALILSAAVVIAGCGDGPVAIEEIQATPILDGPVVEEPILAEGEFPVIEPEGEILMDAAPEAPFVDGVDHVYMPLHAGREWIYEGDKNGAFRRDEFVVLGEPERIDGVACVARYQAVFLDGELAETTTEWFAQDGLGHVWKFGEESLERVGGAWVLDPESWRAGENDRAPWLFLKAMPEVADHYTDGLDSRTVQSLTLAIVLPVGAFEACLSIVENQDDPDDQDIVIYAPTVGLVSETNADGGLELVSVR